MMGYGIWPNFRADLALKVGARALGVELVWGSAGCEKIGPGRRRSLMGS